MLVRCLYWFGLGCQRLVLNVGSYSFTCCGSRLVICVWGPQVKHSLKIQGNYNEGCCDCHCFESGRFLPCLCLLVDRCIFWLSTGL